MDSDQSGKTRPIRINLYQLDSVPISVDEVLNLCNVVHSLKPHLEHQLGREHRLFLSAFSILAADFLTGGCGLINPLQMETLLEAVRILTNFFVGNLSQTDLDMSQECAVKDFLASLSAFCTGTPSFDKKEQSTLVTCLRELATPPYIELEVQFVPGEGATSTGASANAAAAGGRRRESEKLSGGQLDSNRPQTDMTPMILEELMTPLDKDGHLRESLGANVNDPSVDLGSRIRVLRTMFSNKNIHYMQSLGLGDVLIDLCTNLPHLSGYIAQWSEGQGSMIPSTNADAADQKHSFQDLNIEITIAWKALTIPIMEPLTEYRIDKLNRVVMGCLMASVSVATTQSILSLSTSSNLNTSCGSSSSGVFQYARLSSSKDEELDLCAVEIIEKSLELYNSTLNLLRESTRAGGHIVQNFTTIGAWVLVTGLVIQLTKTSQASEKKDNSPRASKEVIFSRLNLLKAQQGFGELSVALGSQALSLCATLLEDLTFDVALSEHQEQQNGRHEQMDPSNFDLFFPFTATQRVAFIFDSVPFIKLLFSVALISYRKSCNLKRLMVRDMLAAGQTSNKSSVDINEEASNVIVSSSAMDDIEEDSDDDDHNSSANEFNVDDDGDGDSEEPLLGKWFEDTLFPPDETTKEDNEIEEKEIDSHDRDIQDVMIMVPEKGDPTGFISLASHIFLFMHKHILTSESTYVKNFIHAKLTEQQMQALAALVKDLDYECSKDDKMEYHLTSLYSEFSTALASFTHNMLANGYLTEKLQNSLLSHLSVYPMQSDKDWPLTVYPRTLAILAQVLLVRQTQETTLQSAKQTNVFLIIWEGLLASLTKQSLQPTLDQDMQDLNIEHVQLLLFFFHSLALMQKKQLLLLTAQSLVKVSKAVNTNNTLNSGQIMHIGKLVLLFEYFMRHLYEPPKDLIEHVKSNIFQRYRNKSILKLNSSPKCFPFKELEGVFGSKLYKNCEEQQQPDTSSKSLYNLFPSLENVPCNEIPKLDGLALSFILGTTDMVLYSKLYESLISLLQVVHQADKKRDNLDEAKDAVISTQYSFIVIWRMLQSLPPSVEFLEGLVSSQSENVSMCTLLHTLVLCPRTGHKVLGPWIKDSLVKQGLTASKSENLVKNVSMTINCVTYDIKIFKQFLLMTNDRSHLLEPAWQGRPDQNIPDFVDLLFLDAILGKVQVSLEALFSDAKNGPDSTARSNPELLSMSVTAAHELAPIVVQLLELFLHCSKLMLLDNLKIDKDNPLNNMTKMGLAQCLAVSGSKCQQIGSLASSLGQNFPACLRTKIANWNETSLIGYPSVVSWRSQSSTTVENLNYEPYLNMTLRTHILSLNPSSESHFKPLKHCLYSAARFASDLYISCPDSTIQAELARYLYPLLVDGCAENLSDLITMALKPSSSTSTSTLNQNKIYKLVMENLYGVLLNAGKYQDIYLSDKILLEIISFMTKLLDEESGRKAMEDFFNERPEFELIQVLLTVSYPEVSQNYVSRVLTFFKKLFGHFEKYPRDSSIQRLCSSFERLSMIPSSELETWLSHLAQGPTTENVKEPIHEKSNVSFLHSLGKFIVYDKSPIPEEVALSILKSLIPLATNSLQNPSEHQVKFSDLLSVMKLLCNAGSGSGHLRLFGSSETWLEHCKNFLVTAHVVDKLETGMDDPKHEITIDNTCNLLHYLSEILAALKFCCENEQGSPEMNVNRAISPADGDLGNVDNESDWIDDINDDEESGAEDSDEENLSNKVCTYVQTQKEFMTQHWYHCHTCKMVDGIGVCSICAKVCHADHDLSYSKYGSFFCDCGAKENGTCRALVKRPIQEGTNGARDANSGQNNFESIMSSSLLRQARSGEDKDTNKKKAAFEAVEKLAQKINSKKELLLDMLCRSNMATDVLTLLEKMLPVLESHGEKYSSVGRLSKIQEAISVLHLDENIVESTDQLMSPTMGSQEGAFESVRMNYSGDQGQTIRQLMTAHMIKRVVMCCLTSGPMGKRQHLAVAHEKGRITILQLSALLKQADSSQKKLTLTRLTSAPVPFTVLSVVSNSVNEGFLAVSGLKDCHVLTFNNGGGITDHLVLHPQLDANNFIIKTLWMPGSQTELALVTADFVKVYDLSVDVLSPQYFFLVPSGKVRDCTLAFMEDGRKYVFIISSAGHVYYQSLSEESMAKHGPFYVTNIMDVKHQELKDNSEQIGGGGVSVFYYHTLQLLFVSYVQGKSFMMSLKVSAEEIGATNLVELKTGTTPSGPNINKIPPQQPLCQFAEVENHPGLLTAFFQNSNNPAVIMIQPIIVSVQEIKIQSKSKIIDLVAIRHGGSSDCEQKTTLIVLCEDGSLKIYMANEDKTDYWLSKKMQPLSVMTQFKPPRSKKSPKVLRNFGSVNFPSDFFEHCSVINDIEFGGGDVLQVYNIQQIKHRFQSPGLYIANTKPGGFTLEVTNNDSNKVMVGIRVMVGTQDTSRVPSYIEVFGRTQALNLTRCRWFDIPLAREESLQSDKKLAINFGPSTDPSGVAIIDNVQVYGQTKEEFGWPDDQDEFSNGNPDSVPCCISNGNSDQSQEVLAALPMTSMERLYASSLDILDHFFHLSPLSKEDDMARLKEVAMTLTSQLISMPVSKTVEQLNKSVLASLFNSKQSYYAHKDQIVLKTVTSDLYDSKNGCPDAGVESFHRLILEARVVANFRPLNLIRFTDSQDNTKHEDRHKFMMQLMNWFWKLLASRPVNASVGTLGQPGITHIEATVHALVDIFHSFTTMETELIPFATQLYAQFLMAENTQVSFAAKQALIRALRPKMRKRKVFIPSPPHCTPSTQSKENASPSNDQNVGEAGYQPPPPPPDEASLNVGPGGVQIGGVAGNLDALLPMPGEGNLPNVLDDMANEVDDEAMVELAIALSLQEQQGEENLQRGLRGLQQGLEQLINLGPDLQGLPGLQGLAGILGEMGQMQGEMEQGEEEQGANSGQDPSHFSDTTASAPGSDDEGSTSAMDRSALRTPPVEQDRASVAESESGGSVIESLTGEQLNMSGRSSAYEAEGTSDERNRLRELQQQPSLTFGNQDDDTAFEINNIKLHNIRLTILDQLLSYIPQLRDIGGVRSIPYMQVVLMLTSDLDSTEEADRNILEKLLTIFVEECNFQTNEEKTETHSCKRSNLSEMQLVVLRLFSVLMSRSKSWQGSSKGSSDGSNYVSVCTAVKLIQSGCIDFCHSVLCNLLDYWKAKSIEDSSLKVASNLLKAQLLHNPPDMSPFFLKQYVKGHTHDVFEAFPQLLTEMTLRLPLQIKKLSDNFQNKEVQAVFNEAWFFELCEYMMTQQTPYVRRQVRKLLLYICGTKERYRELRDIHSLGSHIIAIKGMISTEFSGGSNLQSMMNFSYSTLLQLIEHLKACLDVCNSRTKNWQKFCLKNDTVLSFLFKISFGLDDGVNPIILQLLQGAMCTISSSQSSSNSQSTSSSIARLASSTRTVRLAKSTHMRPKGEKSKSSSKDTNEESTNLKLINQLAKNISSDEMLRFMEKFLLECNSTTVRWQAHSLILTLQRNSSQKRQEEILDLLWKLWPQLPLHGRKAAQFVDLLGYFSMKIVKEEGKMICYVQEAVDILRQQNNILANHPNSNIYESLGHLVDFQGYYLESDPCLVCNNPEVPFTALKLSSLKIDTKYTTSTHIVKLSGSHSISKISLRIGGLKRQKMVRTINIFYNNRSVQAVVELKNRSTTWHKAKKVSLTAGQTDIKVEFPLPIVACNLMIEYADFYENIQATSETLQCPRCSASVPANPGVCGNCGENVFQCHKCRSINYDEKDPFLCNACGFCKYAKFEYTLTSRPCCAVDPIENEDERRKAISSVNSLLEKADKIYKDLIANRPHLEAMILKISESSYDTDHFNSNAVPHGSQVNVYIQKLAQKYCSECKGLFEELSKTIQKVMATRREIVTFDNNRKIQSCDFTQTRSQSQVPGKCFGCSSASVEHCLTLLRALSSNERPRQLLFEQGLIPELVEHNLRQGSNSNRIAVRKLITWVTKDNLEATNHLNNLIFNKISLALKGQTVYNDLVRSIRYEVSLLTYTVEREDSCWEERLRCILKLFLLSTREVKVTPTILECITLPCLRILENLIRPSIKLRKDNNERASEVEYPENLSVDVGAWLENDPQHSFDTWNSNSRKLAKLEVKNKKKLDKEQVHKTYLMEKFFNKWHELTFNKTSLPLEIVEKSWLKLVLFNPTSKWARQTACNMIETFCNVPSRTKKIIDMLTSFLDHLSEAGESASDFCSLYQGLISSGQWQFYLAIKGVLMHIAELITKEIEKLNQLEEATLNSDLAQGFTLKTLVEILANFVSEDRIKRVYKSRLVSNVLHGYLSLRRLVVQRTKLVDQTQEKLLELLEDMTTGTEEETKAFMGVCVQTIQRYPMSDQLTPVFIFERLCNIIYPEETDTGEFFVSLEKDPQQEDFLQGRMLGNPYSSNDPDLGPLMREIKNKICRDCELVALLEDDNGMELLVNNKIISLDLPVKDVYQKVWLPETQNHEGEPMRIIYRMRGLLGDATEEFIETLDNKENVDQDEEEVYKLAKVMADCGGLEVMLGRMESILNIQHSQQLLMVLLKLFGHCIKVKDNRDKLLEPNMRTISILLRCLRLCLEAGETSSSSVTGPSLSDLVLKVMERLLVEAASKNVTIAKYVEFASAGISNQDIEALLKHAVHLKSGTDLHQILMRVLPFLTYGNGDKMSLVIRHFDDVLDFDTFDNEHGAELDAKMQAFVAMCEGIERRQIGNTMKSQMLDLGIIDKCIKYIKEKAPPISSVLIKNDDSRWKEFIAKPSLRYILQTLSGLACDHNPIQLLVADHCIPVLHQMEQVSTEEHVGSFAEAVLEALDGCPEAEAKVKLARDQTKAEKKKLAMAMRAKQLQAFRLKANDQGQVKADNSLLQKFLGIAEESGLCCNICREGYKFQPTKVLGIYTFTMPCHVEESENSSRKTLGYSTVSHFNLVHVDCHSAAVRQMRGRDEWESALLQNANTKCNGLLPLWGPNVPESTFASCLARHNTYLCEATSMRDIGYQSTVQDLKLLLLRFAEDRSFSEETGGGGPQSNMHLVPYILHVALYVLNTTRSVPREEKSLNNFLEQTKDKWLESCYLAEGPLYYSVMSMLIWSPKQWKQKRVKVLQRLLLLAHVRSIYGRPPKSLSDRSVKSYETYKKVVLFFALVDQIYAILLTNVECENDSEWSSKLADWIRNNDDEILKLTAKILSTFQNDLLPATSVEEIVDVCGLLEDIPSPASFLLEVLGLVP